MIIIFHKIEINGRHYKIVIKWFEYYDKKFEINGKYTVGKYAGPGSRPVLFSGVIGRFR